ncbi:hypothetical protein [Ramlibacter tataouinensis]|uniref:Lipoprotein n=1 Tax=Ramlibacter tataouinensis (strain ATCC BAA-407 / DSM 14655 / LMG 21543 / TTB310) TaxID=365046 RepID=F5Y021_RAMTT|nr:hypothetical protein [Ramlibacter tataouinensis]AEG94570.1 hypothetical protein Rta_34570 [Ramlibacter tataouinensis TTB310]
MSLRATLAVLAAAVLSAACGSRPPAPQWQLNARGAIERYQQAFLAGSTRAADAEFARARAELAATGQPALVARAELNRCALQVASLAFGPCPGFDALRADAAPAERAYAAYLAGEPADTGLLPPQHRAVAGGATGAAALRSIEDPLARLVAAGVLVRSGRADPQVLELAADTASAQGWRRALLAWLGAQAQRAEQAGDPAQAQRLRRRMALAAGEL